VERQLKGIALADETGLHSLGTGKHHRSEYYDSAPLVTRAAAAARTSRIQLGSGHNPERCGPRARVPSVRHGVGSVALLSTSATIVIIVTGRRFGSGRRGRLPGVGVATATIAAGG
jgi:hypothetical protein